MAGRRQKTFKLTKALDPLEIEGVVLLAHAFFANEPQLRSVFEAALEAAGQYKHWSISHTGWRRLIREKVRTAAGEQGVADRATELERIAAALQWLTPLMRQRGSELAEEIPPIPVSVD